MERLVKKGTVVEKKGKRVIQRKDESLRVIVRHMRVTISEYLNKKKVNQ